MLWLYLTVVDFSDLAQGCRTYDEFIEKMKDVSETELNYKTARYMKS